MRATSAKATDAIPWDVHAEAPDATADVIHLDAVAPVHADVVNVQVELGVHA
jgi:hypothetical protein